MEPIGRGRPPAKQTPLFTSPRRGEVGSRLGAIRVRGSRSTSPIRRKPPHPEWPLTRHSDLSPAGRGEARSGHQRDHDLCLHHLPGGRPLDLVPVPGEVLAEATAQAAAGTGVEVRPMRCLANCNRGLERRDALQRLLDLCVRRPRSRNRRRRLDRRRATVRRGAPTASCRGAAGPKPSSAADRPRPAVRFHRRLTMMTGHRSRACPAPSSPAFSAPARPR